MYFKEVYDSPHVCFFFFVKKEVENFGQNLASCSKTVFFLGQILN